MDLAISLPEQWLALSAEEQFRFSAELKNEVSNGHPTAHLDLIAIARLKGRDDFLFQKQGNDDEWFVIHLTWRQETSADFPWTTRFASFSDFKTNWKRIWD